MGLRMGSWSIVGKEGSCMLESMEDDGVSVFCLNHRIIRRS